VKENISREGAKVTQSRKKEMLGRLFAPLRNLCAFA
jgi:hypothetical protein